MSDLPERPALRNIEAREVNHKGERVFVLSDPLRLSDTVLGVSLLHAVLLEFVDGSHTIPQISQEMKDRHKVDVPTDFIEDFLKKLDDRCLLRGGKARAAMELWRKEPVRKPACAGGSYPGEELALRGFLEAQYTRQGGPGAPPDRMADGAPIRALLSPHIDFHRGGHAYAWAWKAMAESCEAELFVVFGTAHQGTDAARFALTRKNYETPLGVVETDQELVDRLFHAYEGPDDLFVGELAHKKEHSIEFQMVELAHLYGKGSDEPRKIRALPILCGSIHDLLPGPRKPSQDARVRAFQEALGKALEGIDPEKICFVAGVDLAHVGAEFDDPPLTAKKLEKVMAQDRTSLEIITKKQDADLFHADVAEDVERKICGHSPIHATLEALARTGRKHAGEVLCHDRWYDGKSSVTFCSVAFRATGQGAAARERTK
jgi:AmmeMemoRadiSam system protein B